MTIPLQPPADSVPMAAYLYLAEANERVWDTLVAVVAVMSLLWALTWVHCRPGPTRHALSVALQLALIAAAAKIGMRFDLFTHMADRLPEAAILVSFLVSAPVVVALEIVVWTEEVRARRREDDAHRRRRECGSPQTASGPRLMH